MAADTIHAMLVTHDHFSERSPRELTRCWEAIGVILGIGPGALHVSETTEKLLPLSSSAVGEGIGY